MTTLSQLAESWLATNEDTVVAWRRYLHLNPELSNNEHNTTTFIANNLATWGLHPQPFPGTGLYVDLGGEPDKVGVNRLGLRADIDALAITERSGEPFTSNNRGIMHACGHDLHTAIMMAVACILAQKEAAEGPDSLCPVRLIFQPAEEVMVGGAPDVISWGGLDDVDTMFALHAEPKLKTGIIGLRRGAITSAGDVMTITVSGSGGHTSRPQMTQDVVYALGLIITQLPGLLSRRIDPRSGTVLVFGAVHAGDAANAIPETGTVSGTIRTADPAVWETIESLLRELIDEIVAPTGCTVSIDYTRGVPAVINDDAAFEIMQQAASNIGGPGRGTTVGAELSSGGEDFAWYLRHVPGCLARLGCWSGNGPRHDLHRADACFDEKAMAYGILLFCGVVDAWTVSHGLTPNGA